MPTEPSSSQAWITRFGEDIKGVFAANDGMGVGALEALRQNSLAGKVQVVGLDGIEAAVAAVEACVANASPNRRPAPLLAFA